MKRLRAGIQIIIKVTITLASGKKQVISITVQKNNGKNNKNHWKEKGNRLYHSEIWKDPQKSKSSS